MTWIKICGITNLEDALVAVEAGADALGFVFYDKSPRKIGPEQVRSISDAIPKHVEKIGVFVNGNESDIETVAVEAELTGWQLHTDLTGTPIESALRDGGWLTVRRAVPPSERNVYVSLPADLLVDDEGFRGFGWGQGSDRNITALFIDSGRGEMPGGTGKTFNWPQLQRTVLCLSMNFSIVVAGGLTPDNVSEAMCILHPWGVDVSSGVEARPGKKDPDKIRAFVKAVREADKANSN
jgi:phosphoribosylanthranilate isomerase